MQVTMTMEEYKELLNKNKEELESAKRISFYLYPTFLNLRKLYENRTTNLNNKEFLEIIDKILIDLKNVGLDATNE